MQSDGGFYSKHFHSINFLEVHDNYSFNDYLRISTGENNPEDIIVDKFEHISLSEKLNKMNKVGALLLFTSRGIPLIHQGQEWGSSKIIFNEINTDHNNGKMDPNPYNKDNKTNWIDWNELTYNSDIVDVYEKLIDIRKSYFQFKMNSDQKFSFIDSDNVYCLGYSLNDTILVCLNSDGKSTVKLDLPAGKWNLLFSTNKKFSSYDIIDKQISLEPISGLILKRE